MEESPSTDKVEGFPTRPRACCSDAEHPTGRRNLRQRLHLRNSCADQILQNNDLRRQFGGRLRPVLALRGKTRADQALAVPDPIGLNPVRLSNSSSLSVSFQL